MKLPPVAEKHWCSFLHAFLARSPHFHLQEEGTYMSQHQTTRELLSTAQVGAERGKSTMKIYILGGSGSGKTTLAEDIAVRFHVPHYELDQIGLKNGKVTEDDAFAIAGQPGWVTDGSYLIWSDPLLYQADYIVLLEVSWSVAAWRIIRRHIMKSLHGTNPYPGFNGIKLLFKLLKDCFQ